MDHDEIIATYLPQFVDIQNYINLTDKNQPSYPVMIDKYHEIKILLESVGVNMTTIDKLKL